eukprot:956527-Pyramimonas_sp.AAC.1
MGYACQLSCVDLQRGFVKNRSMSQNLGQLEGYVLHWLVHHGFLDAGFILFDYESAFPALAHEYIFWILEMLTIPAHIRASIKLLYHKVR